MHRVEKKQLQPHKQMQGLGEIPILFSGSHTIFYCHARMQFTASWIYVRTFLLGDVAPLNGRAQNLDLYLVENKQLRNFKNLGL